jgi:DNA-binding MarR family transcriptional regulator
MRLEQAVRIVQATYPQVYLACHTRHQRKRTTEHRLSARDSSILAHLDEVDAVAPALLAKHLGIARSTMSEALKKLVAHGFAGRVGRSAAVVLLEKGRRAISETSVLESARLQAVLAGVPARERAIICNGMRRLADACRDHQLGTARSRGTPA